MVDVISQQEKLQELSSEIGKLHEEVASLRADNSRLIEAWETAVQDSEKNGDTTHKITAVIRFYANSDTWDVAPDGGRSKAISDKGALAREALNWLP